jgi:DNA-binding NarL/FixJ family response regulator
MPVIEPPIEDDLAILAEAFPHVPVVLLSNRDDEATASAAMRWGVRGFFSTSITVEVALAGLRLVLAGGVYRPLPIEAKVRPADPPEIGEATGDTGHVTTRNMVIGLTPREEQVLAGMQLGLPNKLIAARLKVSENTVKMHVQHIMRKCSAHNRTEAVMRLSARLSGHNGS